MSNTIVQIIPSLKENLKAGTIIYLTTGENGRYKLPAYAAFRVKYVGEQTIVAQGLNPDVSLGEYTFGAEEFGKNTKFIQLSVAVNHN